MDSGALIKMAEEINSEIEAPRPSNTLPIVGFAITCIWIIGLLVYGVLNFKSLAALHPNELGDFAGGAFAPLAFLWLVLGFFQQGEELRYSGRALWLQGEELRNSVEQQRELVNVTREQLQFESTVLKQQQEELARIAQPILELRQGGNSPGPYGSRVHELILSNLGKRCTGLLLTTDGTEVVRADALDTGSTSRFQCIVADGDIEGFTVTATYLDERGMPGRQQFSVAGTNHKMTILKGTSYVDHVL